MNTDYEIAQAVIEAVEKAYGIHDLTVRTRKRRIAKPRHLACLIIREITDLSVTDIADILGHVDHTTVLHACKTIREDPKYMRFIPRIVHDAERLLA